MIHFKRVHHIAIICSNYEASKYFYSELLGFTILRENYREDRDSYKLDLLGPQGVQIELFSFLNSPRRISRPEALGLRHLAFAVDAIDPVVAFLKERGIASEPIRIDPYTGRRFTFFNDPDDLPLEIYEELSIETIQ